jgi:hypothetical protein
MTPSRGRGRPRSEEHRDAVLTAAMELMQEDDLRRASIDRIAQRSGVSKATTGLVNLGRRSPLRVGCHSAAISGKRLEMLREKRI